MDNTELHYITYDSEAIWADMMAAYQEAGGDTLYPGDEKDMLLHGVLNMFVLAFAGVDNALRMATLRYAVGEYLDLFGERRDCPRIQAQAAKCENVAFVMTAGEGRNIPKGTALTENGSVTWVTAEDKLWNGRAGTLFIPIVCTTAGTAGNALASGATLQLLASDANVASVTTTEAAQGGVDMETDEAYRARIQENASTPTAGGTAAWYKAVALAASDEVADALAISAPELQETIDSTDYSELWGTNAKSAATTAVTGEGDGTVILFIRPTSNTASAELIQAVQDAVSADENRQLTEKVKVAAGVVGVVQISATVSYDGKTTTRTAIAEASERYMTWQNGQLGKALNLERLKAELYMAGATSVTVSAMFDSTKVMPNLYLNAHVTVTFA